VAYAAVPAASEASTPLQQFDPTTLAAFYEWSHEHSKKYTTGEAYAQAYDNFAGNEAYINEHNAKDSSYTLGHNSFSDMAYDEFAEVMGLGERVVAIESAELNIGLLRGGTPASGEKVHFFCDAECASDLPDEVDWVTKGAVTSVKNQESCGSCWTFSAAGALEGAYAIAGHRLTDFSEQNIVDCDTTGQDSGCNGGLMDSAFEWIQDNGGLCTEDAYPYDAVQGQCVSADCQTVRGSAVTKVTDVQPYSAPSLRAAVAKQPVAVAIEADQRDFQLYSSGVMSGSCGQMLDHGVLLVGYGTDEDSGDAFWKVKNSWGDTWGEAGYIRLLAQAAKKGDTKLGESMDGNDGDATVANFPLEFSEEFFPGRNGGECGILKSPSFPTVAAAKKRKGESE
jgi:hypothetical protein